MNLPATFLEMAAARGRARDEDLPANVYRLFILCPTCQAITDHDADVTMAHDGLHTERAACRVCGHVKEIRWQ